MLKVWSQPSKHQQQYSLPVYKYSQQMMQYVYVTLKPRFPWKSSIQLEEGSFHQQIGLKFKEENTEVLHLEHSFVWSWNLDTSKSRSEVPGQFLNVVLEKDGEDHLVQEFEKWRSTIKSKRGNKYFTYNKKKEC